VRLPLPQRRPARIEMIPLVDLVFLILVSFTYGTILMVAPRGMRVLLPAVRGAAPAGREPVAVTLGRRGEVYVDREPVERDRVVGKVKERLSAAGGGWVLVHGDARAPLESALDVLGRLREGGIGEATVRVAAPEERIYHGEH